MIDIKFVLEAIKNNAETIKYNFEMFEILEGALLKYVEKELKNQLAPDAAKECLERAVPINLYGKITDKVTDIYSGDIKRIAKNKSDQDLVDYYIGQGINNYLNDVNYNYNAVKMGGVEIFRNNNKIGFRVNPSHTFTVVGTDPVNKMRVTIWIKFMGNDIFHIFTDTEFVAIKSNGDIYAPDMADTQGLNPYEIIPFSYISKSKYLLTPIPDSDSKKLTVLLPVMLSDINFAAKYLNHPIVYGVDVDAENLERSPNIFWSFKTIEDGKTPSIGAITPQADLTGLMQVIKEQVALWLDTKDCKVSSINDTDASASGLALMVKNVDTSQNKKKQAVAFKSLEENDFWKRLAIIHNYHARMGDIKNRSIFSDDMINGNGIIVTFPEQKPIEDEDAIINRAAIKYEKGLTSRKRAIMEANKGVSSEEADEIMREIDMESVIETTESGDSDSEDLQTE